MYEATIIIPKANKRLILETVTPNNQISVELAALDSVATYEMLYGKGEVFWVVKHKEVSHA